MEAINIIWDIEDDNDVKLPNEITIPDGVTDNDEISDYLSDQTGYCHLGYRLA